MTAPILDLRPAVRRALELYGACDSEIAARVLDDALEAVPCGAPPTATRVEALLLLGRVRHSLADYPAAEAALSRARELSAQVPNATALRIAALTGLGNAHRTAGRYRTAEQLLREALVLAEGAGDGESAQLAQILNALAVVFKYAGRFEEAEGLLRRALAIAEEALGTCHP